MKQVLLYFVKYPEPGKVKTRLARTLGNEKAAETYRRLAEDNFRTVRSASSEIIEVHVTFDPPAKEKQIMSWLKNADGYNPQRGTCLGARMANAFEDAFARGFEGVMVAGSDTLGLEPAILKQAARALETHDLVLGPARDGGYYLIGLPPAPAFSGHALEHL